MTIDLCAAFVYLCPSKFLNFVIAHSEKSSLQHGYGNRDNVLFVLVDVMTLLPSVLVS
jgi:hypothetical protein